MVRLWSFGLVTAGFLLSAVVLPVIDSGAVRAADSGAGKSDAGPEWSQWRGPHRDGISTETGLLDHWSGDGPPLVWTTKGLGGGHASVVIGGGKIFTMGRRGDGEYLTALDLSDGHQLWSTKIGGGGNSNGTPTLDGDLVYAVGLSGDLAACESASGKLVWKKNFGKDFGGRMMSGWGFAESPLIDGDRLICTPGAQDAMLAALDKRTGAVIWKAAMPKGVGSRGQDGAAYSSIVVSEGAGVRQYVQLTGRGLIGVSAKDGHVLWTYNRVANGTANIPTPIVHGDYVFGSTGYQTGAALLKLVRDDEGVKAEEVYFLDHRKLQNHHGGMILVGDHLYCGHGHGQGNPICIDFLTGKPAWGPLRGAGDGSAAVAYADGHLYFRYQNGTMALIEANPNKYELKGSFKIASHLAESWPHPVIAGGRLYLRDQDVLLCYDIKRK